MDPEEYQWARTRWLDGLMEWEEIIELWFESRMQHEHCLDYAPYSQIPSLKAEWEAEEKEFFWTIKQAWIDAQPKEHA